MARHLNLVKMRLIAYLSSLLKKTFDSKLVSLVKDILIHDIHGKKFNANYHDDEMGDLTNNFGVIKKIGDTYQISLNLRYPNGVKLDDVMVKLQKACMPYDAKVTLDKHQELLYKDPNSDLVKKINEGLSKTYR